jgi:hypothetical protein
MGSFELWFSGLGAAIIGGLVAVSAAFYASRRESLARFDERRLAIANNILDATDSLSSLLYTKKNFDRMYLARRELLRWDRVEGLYGGHKHHKEYAVWLRAHLVRIGILLPASVSDLTDLSASDIEAAFSVLSAIREGTIRWMAARPGRWSMRDWGEDSGSTEATEKVNRIATRLLRDIETRHRDNPSSGPPR